MQQNVMQSTRGCYWGGGGYILLTKSHAEGMPGFSDVLLMKKKKKENSEFRGERFLKYHPETLGRCQPIGGS